MRKREFVVWQVDSFGSLSYLFAEIDGRCGIYWLDFAGGESYVGQSVNIVARLSTHRRRWQDVVTLRFMSCAPEELDELERMVISEAEKSRGLRNKLLTGRPGGLGDVVIEAKEGRSVRLPWEPNERQRLEAADLEGEPNASPSQMRRFESLSRREQYESLRRYLANAVDAAMPDPFRTQRVLWTLSALPNTVPAPGRRRLATLNAGRLELTYATEYAGPEGKSVEICLNLSPEVAQKDIKRALRRAGLRDAELVENRYSFQTLTTALVFPSVESATVAINIPIIANSAYLLAVASMRRGSNPNRSSHNAIFAEDIFRCILGNVAIQG